MILGRTSSNQINIKIENGITRAVNCACCDSCKPCTCNPLCSITKIKVTPSPPNWPTPFIIVNGCNTGGMFCDLFGWSYSTTIAVSVDTTEGFAFFASSYAGNGFKMGGTPYGTYSNGVVIEPVEPV